MYKTVVVIITLISFCAGYDIFEKLMNVISRKKYELSKLTIPSNLSFNNTNFCPIPLFYEKRGYISATPVKETDFPWIARVFHSQTKYTPFLCTAAAIREKVFLTAGVCLATAKVTYTTVEYRTTRLRTKAIVLPQNRSMQMFDDIGFIVVKDSPAPEKWSFITPVSNDYPRTDEHFVWLESWNLGQAPNSSVVGFLVKEVTPDEQKLYEVEGVYVSNHLCNQLLPATDNSGDYFAPCYHYCSVQDHKNGTAKRRYLRGLGHVVYSKEMQGIPTPTLIGVATWSCDAGDQSYLPVGIAIPNSNAYYADLNCALKIRDDDGQSVKSGHYQTLCDA